VSIFQYWFIDWLLIDCKNSFSETLPPKIATKQWLKIQWSDLRRHEACRYTSFWKISIQIRPVPPPPPPPNAFFFVSDRPTSSESMTVAERKLEFLEQNFHKPHAFSVDQPTLSKTWRDCFWVLTNAVITPVLFSYNWNFCVQWLLRYCRMVTGSLWICCRYHGSVGSERLPAGGQRHFASIVWPCAGPRLVLCYILAEVISHAFRSRTNLISQL